MPNLFRSLIFVPGNNPKFLAKSLMLHADIICLDLEDSVPLNQKSEARRLVSDLLSKDRSNSVFVRINNPNTSLYIDDLKHIMKGTPPDGVVIPKVNDTKDLHRVLDLTKELEPAGCKTLMLPSIESAAGVLNTYDIACSERVCSVVFGIFDLLNDMGVEYTKSTETAIYSRSKVPVDATAAGVAAIDGIWQDIHDVEGFEADCKFGRSLGYSGKSLIHPAQIDTTHTLFAPTPSEMDWARRVCDTYEHTLQSGKGATTLDGRMIDEVHYKQALAVLNATESKN